ncbi:MAG: 4Fe-4S binding protein [Faecalibacterium sp.]|nr:4Fe-4S binding protein [Ruminococcus sp.]MCM1391168.1 4Fe-4S binding protein [Ruminococcus sp.]MCM1486118.1 4Fe-4S binding protein [Faecalibacterium sp.]
MITLNPLYCKGCGYCIKFCPKHILEMGKERSVRGFFFPVVTDESACISCGICASMCPDAAIELPKK